MTHFSYTVEVAPCAVESVLPKEFFKLVLHKWRNENILQQYMQGKKKWCEEASSTPSQLGLSSFFKPKFIPCLFPHQSRRVMWWIHIIMSRPSDDACMWQPFFFYFCSFFPGAYMVWQLPVRSMSDITARHHGTGTDISNGGWRRRLWSWPSSSPRSRRLHDRGEQAAGNSFEFEIWTALVVHSDVTLGRHIWERAMYALRLSAQNGQTSRGAL